MAGLFIAAVGLLLGQGTHLCATQRSVTMKAREQEHTLICTGGDVSGGHVGTDEYFRRACT